MAQIRKAEAQAEIRCHADKFFDAWARKPYFVSELCPVKLPKVELLEGNWHAAPGVKYTWHYAFGNHCGYVTTEVERLDEENRTLYYNIVDGQMLEQDYKSYRENMQVTPAGDGTSIVKWSCEYEKMREDAPDAEVYVNYLIECSKEMDAKLCAE